MAGNVQIISVFIGSPSGLEAERRAARDVVDELNRDHARHWGCLLELVGWEETLPGHGRPQELINQDLDRCEYFIGVLYDHWGSPPADGDGCFTSGFQEEFERAKMHVQSGVMKNMAVYFKEIPDDRRRDPGQSLKKVLKFKEDCFERKDALYTEFPDLAAFESLVRKRLTAIGWSEFEQQRAKPALDDKASTPEQRDGASKSDKPDQARLIAPPTQDFLAEMMKRSSEWEETDAYDVARLRLVAASLHRSGNDETVLGAHDANMIFRRRRDMNLSNEELRALIDCGVQHFVHQNAPFWHWLSEYTNGVNDQDYLAFKATFGKPGQQASAIELITLLGHELLDIGEYINRDKTIRGWLEGDSAPRVFKASTTYLRLHGNQNDAATLEELYKQSTSQKQASLGQAIVAIEARSGEARAIERALDLGVDEIDQQLENDLFGKPSSLTTELLARCLKSPASRIRRSAIAILNERKETDPAIADTLLSDTDYGVRFYAAEALHIAGRSLDDDAAKKVLTIVKKSGGLNLLVSRETDKSYYDRYRLNRLSEMSFQQLNSAVENGDVFDEDEAFALFKQHPRKMKEQLRTHLNDGFKDYYESRLNKMRELLGDKSDTLEKTEKLIPFLRRRLISTAIEALAGLELKDDLDLIRHVLDNHEVDISDSLVGYLGKLGDWSDLQRIQALGDHRPPHMLLLHKPASLPQKAKAMVSIAHGRIADLMAESIEPLQRRAVLHQLRRKEVLELSDEVILEALGNKDEECRVIIALKCCEFLTKKRLETLLERYTEHDNERYYNSIHWLDMGVSLPREIARSVARQQLSSRL